MSAQERLNQSVRDFLKWLGSGPGPNLPGIESLVEMRKAITEIDTFPKPPAGEDGFCACPEPYFSERHFGYCRSCSQLVKGY